ncbi:hypothetical protein B0H13DRAFT_1586455, partial [Mycena leptocephala]
GRGIRCVAVDRHTNQKCLLKVTWRIICYHPEGEVYERLHTHNVRNIFWPLEISPVVSIRWLIRQHQHYRIVLDVVGEALLNFQSTCLLTKYMLDVLDAHHDAFKKAKVEHHDVSVGNIIIAVKDGSSAGLLID